jgi:gluconate kinase
VPALVFVFIAATREGDESLLAARLQNRPSHFFSASLLSSQLATLEPPAPGERAIRIPLTLSIAEAIDTTLVKLHDEYRCEEEKV